ncbi:MAG: ABC transporter substrate-binding protein [Dehalococcoidia bacterium]|nr:ABC transporter substrate-binding protein [Dehalococcoidia bacterium]
MSKWSRDRINRRDFVRKVGLAGASLAGLGLLGCTPGAQAPAPAPTTPPQAAATTPPKAAVTTVPSTATPKPAPVKVRIGHYSSSATSPEFIAFEKGYYKEQNLEVELVAFTGLMEMVPLLASGELDEGTGAWAVAVINAVRRGIPMKLVAPGPTFKPPSFYVSVVVRKDLVASGAVKTINDLKGRAFGLTSLRTINDVMLDAIFASEKATIRYPDDLNIVTLGFPDMYSAFANKSLDAALVVEPHSSGLEKQGLAVRWKAPPAPTQTGSVIFSEKILKTPDVAGRLMLARLKGGREYVDVFFKKKGKISDLAPIIAKYTPIKTLTDYEEMEMPYIDPNGRNDRQSLAASYKYFLDKGWLEGAIDLDSFIDESASAYAVKALGEYV